MSTATETTTARPGLPGEDLTGSPYLAALADLHDAARAAATHAADVSRCPHKGRRRSAGMAYEAIGAAMSAAWAAIETEMREHRQPVSFTHNGWRWSIPSAGRGMIVTPADRQETRRDRKEGR
jgi:hypothetical protein